MKPWMFLFFTAAIALVRERQRVNGFIERVTTMPPRFLVVVIVVALLAVPQLQPQRAPDPRVGPPPPPPPNPPVALNPPDAGTRDALPPPASSPGSLLAKDQPAYAGEPVIAVGCTDGTDPLNRACALGMP